MATKTKKVQKAKSKARSEAMVKVAIVSVPASAPRVIRLEEGDDEYAAWAKYMKMMGIRSSSAEPSVQMREMSEAEVANAERTAGLRLPLDATKESELSDVDLAEPVEDADEEDAVTFTAQNDESEEDEEEGDEEEEDEEDERPSEAEINKLKGKRLDALAKEYGLKFPKKASTDAKKRTFLVESLHGEDEDEDE